MRMVRLARAVGGIESDAQIGLDHLYNPAGEAEKPLICAVSLILSRRDRLR
jgi:hypothetical protein